MSELDEKWCPLEDTEFKSLCLSSINEVKVKKDKCEHSKECTELLKILSKKEQQ